MQGSSWTGIGAIICAVAVAAGAFGAHGLKRRLTPAELALWETAARYLIVTGFGLIGIGLAAGVYPRSALGAAGLTLAAGGILFSGTVGALALGAPRWLGAITPLGGLGLIAGFLLLAWQTLRT